MAAVELGSTTLFNDGNLIAYYKLENVNDSKASFNLTNNNVSTFTAGQFNNAATLNGTNQSLTTTSTLGVTTDINMALTLWVNVSSQPAANTVAVPTSYNNGAHRYWLEYADVSGIKKLQINTGSGPSVIATQTLTTSSWYNIVINYTASSGVFDLYLNNSLLGSITNTNKSTNVSGFSIGQQGVAEGNFWNGLIDDTGVFTRKLTLAEINYIYTGVSPTVGGAFLTNFI